MQGSFSVFTIIRATRGPSIHSQQLDLSEHVDNLHPVIETFMELVWLNTLNVWTIVSSTDAHGVKTAPMKPVKMIFCICLNILLTDCNRID
jgi:hypothetical protein